MDILQRDPIPGLDIEDACLSGNFLVKRSFSSPNGKVYPLLFTPADGRYLVSMAVLDPLTGMNGVYSTGVVDKPNDFMVSGDYTFIGPLSEIPNYVHVSEFARDYSKDKGLSPVLYINREGLFVLV
ncbi:MAG: hypothetical protein HY831_02830 [Candidatus Aenigmarchaeota archaeon]|nr:hypothetical protein [Candidatus Aenigmarchaeota archaeon]